MQCFVFLDKEEACEGTKRGALSFFQMMGTKWPNISVSIENKGDQGDA